MTSRFALVALLFALVPSWSAAAEPGILLLAHGGSPEWNARVNDLAATVNKTKPTEVAFGMASRANLQRGVDRLVARGVTSIVAVPLFVSSWSSVVASTEYLLGQRDDAPAALAVFAKMSHGDVGHGGHGGKAGHGAGAPVDATKPVASPVPIRMTAALNDHAVVAQILATRAREIGKHPPSEALLIVAHGPNEEEANQKWLADMRALARQLARTERFASIDYLTVRDDAPKPIWEKARAELRSLVQKRHAGGRRVLIVPLVLSFGGIEKGLRERLVGLNYTMASSGLMPDDRLVGWVLEMADHPAKSGEPR